MGKRIDTKRNRPWLAAGDRHNNATVKQYHTPRWRRLRKQILMSEPLCRLCAAKGITTAAQMIDHIEPVRQGGEFFELRNLQPLCNKCHAIKSGDESKMYR